MRYASERLLLSATASWQLGLATVTLLPYREWFEGSASAELAHSQDMAATQNTVVEYTNVISVYGLGVLALALAAATIAFCLPQLTTKAVAAWLGSFAFIALLSADVIAVLLLTITLTIHLARRRATMRQATQPISLTTL